MATAILAIASRDRGLAGLAWALVGLAWALQVALLALHAHGLVRARRPARLDAVGAEESWRPLSFVAATDTLAVGSGRLLAPGVVLAMWLVAVVGWAALAAKALRDWRGGRVRPRGGWLLVVVATQSLSIVAASGRLPVSWAPLSVLAWSWFAASLAGYLLIVAAIARRFAGRGRLARWRADGWIVMGALAITALAGSELHRDLALLLPWAAATLSIPFVAGLDVAALRARGRGLLHETDRWAMAFPLAMWSVASHAVAQHLGTRAVDVAGAVGFWAGLAAWLLAAHATATSLGRPRFMLRA
jgi:hypothetical protein